MAGGLHRDFRGQRPHVGLTCPGPSTERVLRTFTEPGQLQRLAARQKGTSALGLVGGRARPKERRVPRSGADIAARRYRCGDPVSMAQYTQHERSRNRLSFGPAGSSRPPRAAVRCGEPSPLSPGVPQFGHWIARGGTPRAGSIAVSVWHASSKAASALPSASERAAGSIAKRVSTARAAPVDWCASAANRSIPASASSLGARRGPAAADVVAEHHAVA